MRNYLLKRSVNILFMIFTLSIALFFLINILPGSSSSIVFYELDNSELVEQYNENQNLSGNILTRYFTYLNSLLHLDFGQSIYNTSVSTLVLDHFETTFRLAILSLFFTLILSNLIVFISYYFKNKLCNIIKESLVLLSYSMPPFVLAIIFIIISMSFNFVPISGYSDLSLLLSLHYLILPSFIIAIIYSGFFISVLSNGLEREFKRRYILLAKSKGHGNAKIFCSAYINVKNENITLISQSAISLLTSSAAIEYVFSLPGLGNLIIMSIASRDLNTLHAILVLSIVISLVLSFISDIVLFLLDRRLKIE